MSEDDDRRERANEGRQLFGHMLAEFRRMGETAAKLAVVADRLGSQVEGLQHEVKALSESNRTLARQVGELTRAQHVTCQHSATLQEQIAVLVQQNAQLDGGFVMPPLEGATPLPYQMPGAPHAHAIPHPQVPLAPPRDPFGMLGDLAAQHARRLFNGGFNGGVVPPPMAPGRNGVPRR